MHDPEPGTELQPILKRIEVPLSVEAAFTRFTAEISSWWPIATHSVGQGETDSVILEGEVGGRLYEHRKDGTESDWGRITAWEPPGRVAFTWHPGRDPAAAQEVDVRFRQADAGTEIELIHRGWEALGAEADDTHHRYESGWTMVLDRFVGA